MKQITREEFEKKYYRMSNVDFAKELGVSAQTIAVYAKKFGIKPKGRGAHSSGRWGTKVKLIK
jgi:hypothetical protein